MGSNVRVHQTMFRSQDFRQVRPDLYASPAVSDAEAAAAKKGIEKLEKQAEERLVAHYKIEITFGVRHHVATKPTYGALVVYESGTKLHGGGDALLYQCPGKHTGRNECESIIPDHLLGGSTVICPACYTAWSSDVLIGQTQYTRTIESWADIVEGWFRRLGSNADIVVKHFYDDIRAATAKEQEKELRGEVLEAARSKNRRIQRVYTLAEIVKDVNAGDTLYNRIYAFLRM